AIAEVFAAPRRGIAAYDQLFRSYLRPTSFDAVFGDWVAANALGDATLDDGRFGYRNNLVVNPTTEPGPALRASVVGRAAQLGATYYRIEPTAASTLAFTG